MSELDLEQLKRDSRGLRGTIAESLEDDTTGGIAEIDLPLLKFHGLYQQDDRDLRAERREARLEPLHSFMIRIRLPGGVATNEQWQAIDALADEVANTTLRITTRQTIQYHGVFKEDLRTLMQRLDSVNLDSIAACGDVNRNVVCHVQPDASPVHEQTLNDAREISRYFLPKTQAWREIWVDGKRVDADVNEEETFYGDVYMPRKFKIGIALPPVNDIDVYSQDLGFIAIPNADNTALEGYNLVVGGGMGCTHGELHTYPRLGNVIGFFTPEHLIPVAEAVLGIQRDHGNREDRKQARFKYTVDRLGLDWIEAEVNKRAGITLAPARDYTFTQNGDRYGWIEQQDGRWQLTVFVENGRLLPKHREGINQIVANYAGDIRLTTNQNLIVAGVAAEHREAVDALIEASDLGSKTTSAIRLNAMACVALPTCGLAMAESERYLPSLLTQIEALAERHGIQEEPITIRMTGCPNGCARPFLSEIGFVGRAPGRYNMYLGAAFDGSRLNKLYLDNVDEAAILTAVDELFGRYSQERESGEHFGDFLVRVGVVEGVNHGSEVHREAQA